MISKPAAILSLMASLLFSPWAASQGTSTYQVGLQPDGSYVTPANQIVTPAGAQVNFNGRPMAIAVRPDQKTAALLVAGGGYNLPTLPVVIVDLATGTVKQEFNPGIINGSYDGVIYSKDGAHLYFSQDTGRVVVADVASDGTLSLHAVITLPPPTGSTPVGSVAGTVNNGGLALSGDGKYLYVVQNMVNSVAVIDLTTKQIATVIPVQNAPASIVVLGNRAYVTNQGGRPANPGEYTDLSAGTPIVADPETASSITGTVSVIDLKKNIVVENISVGLQPTAILAANGLIFVANTNGDSVSVIDPSTNKVLQTLSVRPFQDAPLGSFPNGLVVSSRNELAVSLGGNNAVAFYRFDNKGSLALEGFVPAAWYPSYVAAVAALNPQQSGISQNLPERLLIANAKGTGLGSNVPNTGNPGGKNTHSFVGSMSIVPMPTPEDFVKYDAKVALNNGWGKQEQPQPPPPLSAADRPIQHIFYVIKENQTYDAVLGDDPRGNGDPTLAQFGGSVSPNHHALAAQFVLFDNFYDSGVLSADGHQWANQAFAPDYLERQFVDFNRSYPSNGGDSLDYLPTGFLWTNALAHRLTVRFYGEYAPSNSSGFVGPPGVPFGSWTDWYNDSLILEGKKTGSLHLPLGTYHSVTDVPSAQQNMDVLSPNFNTGIPDQYRFDIFLMEFQQYVKNGNLPNLMFIKLCDDHTSGGSLGFPTPAAQVADNDLALGRLVDTVSHSPYWSSSAIFVLEDDSQNDVDHVDGHRSLAYILSPYTKRAAVNHTYYTQVNMVRTIEELLGLPPMNQHDKLVSPMFDAFMDVPDLSSYTFIPNQIPLDTLNTPATSKLEKAWQTEIARYFPQGPNQQADLADPNLLNHAMWYANKHYSKPFPGETRVFYPSQVPHIAPADRADRE